MEIKKLSVGMLKTNCYLISSEDEIIIIDPGGSADEIIAEVKKQNKKLKYIIYTHYHYDHILAGNEIRAALKGEALIHSGEKEFCSGLEIDRLLEEEDILKIGKETIKVLHTPGHTTGSICLLGNGFIITGDTLFQDGIGRTDLPGGSEKDIKRSLKKIDNIMSQGMRICPGHGPDFIKRN